jgi:hypothetical protein
VIVHRGDDVVCPLCNDELNDGQPLSVWVTDQFPQWDGSHRPEKIKVHASCAQELRGQAEG